MATLRKRRLLIEIMAWVMTGMALFRSHSMNQLVSHLNILLPGIRLYVAGSAVVRSATSEERKFAVVLIADKDTTYFPMS
ncbi:transposase domain-containing protein [Atlantibacter hermannii]|uniref:transposase domain-containing protein n=1 Tax=Atlantibacter hermannii TaxID=565 RepID=UPI0019337AB5|nr:transposase domain-containing protein [Atlantibacter hermannii]MBL7635729.1 transposase domain-containing protein [Atlantibacter hermannii]MBL7676641.1 transposase domain-containing protein [Atlantibacter hermannii]